MWIHCVECGGIKADKHDCPRSEIVA
jgi:hypothetical protein